MISEFQNIEVASHPSQYSSIIPVGYYNRCAMCMTSACSRLFLNRKIDSLDILQQHTKAIVIYSFINHSPETGWRKKESIINWNVIPTWIHGIICGTQWIKSSFPTTVSHAFYCLKLVNPMFRFSEEPYFNISNKMENDILFHSSNDVVGSLSYGHLESLSHSLSYHLEPWTPIDLMTFMT